MEIYCHQINNYISTVNLLEIILSHPVIGFVYNNAVKLTSLNRSIVMHFEKNVRIPRRI